MIEHDEKAEELEREANALEHDSERVGTRIDETRRDWAAKEQDPTVPGAQADPDDADEDADEDEGADEDAT
jgi:hypothetical protein